MHTAAKTLSTANLLIDIRLPMTGYKSLYSISLLVLFSLYLYALNTEKIGKTKVLFRSNVSV